MPEVKEKVIALKQPVIDEIKKNAENASSVVLVDHRGLTVEQDTRFRKELREAGVTYKVYKNTLLKRAFDGTDFSKLDEKLEGPSAVAFSYEDATAAARIISKYVKETKILEVKAGVVEGQLYDAKQMEAIAAIPSRDELISKLLGSMKSPITNLARVLSQIAEKGGASAAAPAEEAAPAEAEAPVAEEAPAEAAAPAEAEAAPAEAEAASAEA